MSKAAGKFMELKILNEVRLCRHQLLVISYQYILYGQINIDIVLYGQKMVRNNSQLAKRQAKLQASMLAVQSRCA